MLLALALRLGWLRWEVPGLLLVLKSGGLVRTIAKRLACRVAATAKGDSGPASKAVRLAIHIDEFHFPFDSQRAVIADSDLRRGHLCSYLRLVAPAKPGRGVPMKSGA